ncbi:unnamed protein product [Discosporangium mesarthrocarpum]
MRERRVCAVIATHVDDMMFIGEGAALSWTKRHLYEHFNTSDLGELAFYMGCEISRDRSTYTITIKQPLYIKSMRKCFGVTECSKTRSYDASRRLDGEHGQTHIDIPYREAVRSMMRAAIMIRPDTANSVRDVAKNSIEPKAGHWRAVKCVL